MGVTSALTGYPLDAIASAEVKFSPAHNQIQYNVSQLASSSSVAFSYRVTTVGSIGAEFSRLVDEFSSMQTGFDQDVARLITQGWDEIFD